MVGAPLTYTLPMQGRWAHSQWIYRGCGLVEGEKDIFLISNQGLFWEVLCWKASLSEIGSKWLGPLDACYREIGR